MTTYFVHYTYDHQSAARDEHRAAHRAFLQSRPELVFAGRFDDDGEPGAALMFNADSVDDVESLLNQDPYVIQGLVASHEVRLWVGLWGTLPV